MGGFAHTEFFFCLFLPMGHTKKTEKEGKKREKFVKEAAERVQALQTERTADLDRKMASKASEAMSGYELMFHRKKGSVHRAGWEKRSGTVCTHTVLSFITLSFHFVSAFVRCTNVNKCGRYSVLVSSVLGEHLKSSGFHGFATAPRPTCQEEVWGGKRSLGLGESHRGGSQGAGWGLVSVSGLPLPCG